jgi:hypothetical protein
MSKQYDLEQALAEASYLADKENYEVDDLDDMVRMARPGGGGQAGILYYSHHLKPWILAAQIKQRLERQLKTD